MKRLLIALLCVASFVVGIVVGVWWGNYGENFADVCINADDHRIGVLNTAIRYREGDGTEWKRTNLWKAYGVGTDDPQQKDFMLICYLYAQKPTLAQEFSHNVIYPLKLTFQTNLRNLLQLPSVSSLQPYSRNEFESFIVFDTESFVKSCCSIEVEDK